MPRFVTILSCFILNLLLFSTFTHAWTFRWTNEEKQTRIINGKGNRNCTVIEMRKGREYKWDPEGSVKCINFFADDKCTPEEKNGWSCPVYGPRKNSQPWVRSFLVNEDGDELPPPLGSDESSSTSKTSEATSKPTDSPKTSTSETSSSTEATATSDTESESASPTDSDSDDATSTPLPTESVTSSPTPTPTPSSESTAMSGGGIAGAVVGAVAGVGALVGVALFVLRRRRPDPQQAHDNLRSETDSLPPPRYGAQELSPVTPISPGGAATLGYHHDEGIKSAQKQFIAELPANNIVEMGASRGKEQ